MCETGKVAWRSVQIGYRSKYTVERLQALDEYYRNTSRLRLIAFALLTPVPALLLVITLECIPLREPSEGWRANYASWFRLHVMGFTIALGLVFQIKGLIVGLFLSTKQAVAIAALTSGCHIGVMIAASILWVFPLPFGIVLSVIPFVMFFVVFFLLAVGRREFETIPDLGLQLRRQIYIVIAQAILVLVYPSFSALYLSVSSHYQAGLVMLLPFMKIVMKNFVARSSSHLEEFVPEVVVFSVEVFNALYVAICMQTAGSAAATTVILTFDAVNSVLSIRSIHYETEATRKLQKRYRSTALLQNVIDICNQPGILGNRESASISLRSPIQHQLSGEGCTLLEGLVRRQLIFADTIPLLPAVPSEEVPPPALTHSNRARKSRSTVVPLDIALAPVREEEVSTPLSVSEQIEMVHETLRLLFHCEYLVLVEYIECVIPLLYAVYLSILFQLPNAKYYPHTADMTDAQLANTVVNLIVYVWLEVVSFLGLHLVLKRKFGFSPAYVLGFVLERQASQLQGRLFVWIIYILQFTLVHFGTCS